MIPKYDFDNSYDIDQTSLDRNVLNTKDMNEKTGFIVKTDEAKRAAARSSRYESVEFTERSVDFTEPFEDEELLSGRVKPTVAGYYNTGYDGSPNVYNPTHDKMTGRGNVSFAKKEASSEPLPKEAYGSPEFFKNPVDLTIACVALAVFVIVELIILYFVLFK